MIRGAVPERMPESPTPPVRVRLATPADAAAIAWHRCRMFEDMGRLPAPALDELHAGTAAYLVDALARGEYVGWLASPEGEEHAVVAGAGVQLRRALPHPADRPGGGAGVAQGRHGIVLNVYTERAWRRRGVAELLMRQVLAWARDQRLDRLVLHASAEGRSLYERLGFLATNEMRFAGEPDVPATASPIRDRGRRAAYVVVQIAIDDPEAYERYKALAPPSIAAYGGRYVVRGGDSEVLEGTWRPPRLVVLEFPSAAQARAWWESPEYAPAKALRQHCARTEMLLIEGSAATTGAG